jgi:hypothetical protein
VFGRRKRQHGLDSGGSPSPGAEESYDGGSFFGDEQYDDDQPGGGQLYGDQPGGGQLYGDQHSGAAPWHSGGAQRGGAQRGGGSSGGGSSGGADARADAEAGGTVPRRGRHAAPEVEGAGPWDAGQEFSQLARADLGSLLVPMGPDYQMQLIFAEQQGAWVSVHHGSSDLQLMAFAAPRTDSLWDEVRTEIATEITSAGGSASEQDGPFGRELIAAVPAQPGSPDLVALRFVGVDGPRWFLRGLFSGQAAVDRAHAIPLENLFREVVVVRGKHPVPPREPLELRLPPEAQQQLAEQQAAMAEAQAAQAQGGVQPLPHPNGQSAPPPDAGGFGGPPIGGK